MSMVTGILTSTLDSDIAAARDVAFRSGPLPPPREMPGIGHEGCLVRSADDPMAGERAVQGMVHVDERTGLFDDLLGPGFALVLAEGDPDELVGPELITYLTRDLRDPVVSLDPTVARGVKDADGALTAWLRGNGVAAVLSRPDAYVFGSAPEPSGAAELVHALRADIPARPAGAPAIAQAG